MAGNYPSRIRKLEPYDGRFDAYRLRSEGAEVLFASYPAGTSIPPHTHDTDNLGVVIRGELKLIMHGKTQHFGVGDWYQVSAHVEHSASFDVETDEIEFWFKAGS